MGLLVETRSACRRLAALAATCTVVVAAPSAQQPSPFPTPSFSSRTDLVLVDLRVSRGNEPVTDLQPDEVTLLVDGVPRPVVSLLYAPVVVSPGQAPGAASSPATTPAAPRAGAPTPRRIVFLVDRDSLDAGEARQLQKTAEGFVGRLPGEVTAAVATLPLGSSLLFKTDRDATVAALRQAFEGITRRGLSLEGVSGFGCTGGAASAGCGDRGIHPSINAPEARAMNASAEWLVRGRRTLQDLQGLFRTLAGGPPSDVVIVSGALPFQSGLRTDIDRTFAVARSAGIRVHAVEIADLTSVPLPEGGPEGPPNITIRDDREVQEQASVGGRSLQEKSTAVAYGLPEETGGIQAHGAVSGADFFTRLARDLASTYLLSFAPIDSDRTGTPHRIEVRIARRPPLTIYSRKTFIAPPASLARESRAVDTAGQPSTPTPGAMALTPTPATVTPSSVTSGSRLTKTDAWVALVQAHQPGARDRALIDVAQWNSDDLRAAMYGLGALRRRASSSSLNDTLAQGAVLHTDLALLAPDLAQRFRGFPEWEVLRTVEARDGQALASSVVSAHWRLARALLDGTLPRPADDPRVREWYRAVGATLLADQRYATALPHLNDAQRLFPHDRDVNMLSGLLHETLAVAASHRLLGKAQVDLAAPVSELQLARRDLTRAIDADPKYDVAELHLARVFHLLGDDKAAARGLAHVLSRSQDADIRFLAELLAGSIHEAAGRPDAARESFERAAALRPQAQSALVALSHIAREAGRRSDAIRYIDRLAALPASADGRDDPWWHYESAAVADHAALLNEFRATLPARRAP